MATSEVKYNSCHRGATLVDNLWQPGCLFERLGGDLCVIACPFYNDSYAFIFYLPTI